MCVCEQAGADGLLCKALRGGDRTEHLEECVYMCVSVHQVAIVLRGAEAFSRAERSLNAGP